MRKLLLFVLMVVSILTSFSVAKADLINAGDNGEWFFDSLTGLYWYDPFMFSGANRDQVDSFVQDHSLWQYATFAEILTLYDTYKVIDQNAHLSEIIGQATGAIGIEGYGGVLDGFEGFYAGSGSGSMELYVERRDMPTIFFPYMAPAERTVATSTSGAWLVANRDPSGSPVPEPSTLLLAVTGLVGLAGFRRIRQLTGDF